MSGQDNLKYALMCAEQLGPVLPSCWATETGSCGDGRGHREKEIGKAPLTMRGVLDATRERSVIEDWWGRQWPKANVSVALERGRILLVDPDTEEAQAEAVELGLPPTPVRISRSPGYLYARPVGAPIGMTIHRGRSRAIDVMTRGYVVAFGRHRTGCDIYIEWLGELAPAPAWAIEMLNDAVVAEPVELPADLPRVRLETLGAPGWLYRLIRRGRAVDPERYSTRSEAGWVAIRELVRLGHTDATIAALMLDPKNAAGEKARECGRKWLGHEIGRARKKPRESGPDLAEALPVAGSSIGMGGTRIVRRLPSPTRPRGILLPSPTRPGGVALPPDKRGAA